VRNGGYPIVLTAERTLMAEYTVLFDGMMGTIQTTLVPEPIMRTMIAPPAPRAGVAAQKAPLGLRRIEAALVNDGFGCGDVVVCAPEALDRCIGPNTRIVAVSSSDPLGRGMANSTMIHMTGGRLYTRAWYARLLHRIKRYKARIPFKVVAGGAGTWQLIQDERARRDLGIDACIHGYAEGQVGGWFRQLAAGEMLPAVLAANGVNGSTIPAIRGASLMGAVELSRGCGKGCHFCTMAAERLVHLPVATIVADVEANLARGASSICALSEDFFRYGAGASQEVDPPRLKMLLARLRQIRALRLIQIDHANVTSVAQYSDDDLRDVHDLLVDGQRHDYLWVNLGVESASGELLAQNQLDGKIHPFVPQQWDELCETQVRRLVRTGYFPMVSLIMGLPGERPEHVAATVRWIERLSRERLVIFPIFYTPVSAGPQRAFTIDDMTPMHWRLYRSAYNLNFKWIPRMYWDNQSGAGAPLWRRLFIQATGRLQALQWRARFVQKSRRLFA
jgi:radical SAM superfamily enzyme YgiQ (UPF0313 family)